MAAINVAVTEIIIEVDATQDPIAVNVTENPIAVTATVAGAVNTASQILITDAGEYYTGDDVEDALQEIGAGTTLDGRYVNVTGDTMGALLINKSSTTALVVEDSGTKDDVLVVDTVNGRVGINVETPLAPFHVRGGAQAFWLTTTDFALGTTGTRLIIAMNASTGNTYGRLQATDEGGISDADLVLQEFGGNVGIGIGNPDGKLHVFVGSAGEVAPQAQAAQFVVESNSHAGMSILVPDNKDSNIFLGSPTDNKGAIISWN
ncbi:MAG: hypothetical protein JRC86_10845, partial [Deltaproteobacteria bacterium]|nr:hypothetical protein [Deltaproteobacteria bacterium]